MAEQQIHIISGPSGAGKDALAEIIQAKGPQLHRTRSWTTRPQKDGENDKYHHVTEEVFHTALTREEFVECAQVHGGHWYGTPRGEIEGKVNVLLEIDCQGAECVKKMYPHAHATFILPPSRAVLKARLEARRREDEMEIHRRLLRAAIEVHSHAKGFDSWVVNGDDRGETASQLILLINLLRRGKKPDSFYRDEAVLNRVRATFPSYASDLKFL